MKNLYLFLLLLSINHLAYPMLGPDNKFLTEKEKNLITIKLSSPEGQEKGFITFSHDIENKSGNIKKIWVAPEFRNQKLGTQLMQQAFTELKHIGCKSVEWTAMPDCVAFEYKFPKK